MPGRLRYEPQSASGPGSCGIPNDPGSNSDYNFGLNKWQKWYDAGNEAVPEITPGGDFFVRQAFTAQHGGQGWMQIQCLPEATETRGEGHFPKSEGWLNLERAEYDRSVGYLPSNPEIYAWRGGTKDVYYHVPANFSCQSRQNRAIGRWVWKVGNSCNDMSNTKGFGVTTFKRSEWLAAGGTTFGQCANPPEVFISCIDFKVNEPLVPTPAPPTPQPTPAPAPPQCCTGQGGECSAPCSTAGWCGASESNCLACAGSWCGDSSPTPPAPTPPAPPSPTPPAPAQCCTGQGGKCDAPCSTAGWCGAS